MELKSYFKAVVAHVFLLLAEAAIGGLFLLACYKRLKRQQVSLQYLTFLETFLSWL